MEKFRIPSAGTGSPTVYQTDQDSALDFPQQPNIAKNKPFDTFHCKTTLAKQEVSSFKLLADPVHPNRSKEIIKARDIQEFIDDLDSVKRGFEELGIHFDDAFNQCMRDRFDLNEFCRLIDNQLIALQSSEMKEIHQEKLERIKEVSEKLQKSKVWKHFANIAAVVTGVVGILSTPLTGGISTAVSIALLVTTLGNAVDSCFDNRGKKALGRLVTDGSDASAEKFAGYFGMGLAAIQIICSLGLSLAPTVEQAGNIVNASTFISALGSNASTAIGVGSNALSSATTIGKGVTDYRLSCSRGDQAQTELELDHCKDELDALMNTLKRATQEQSTLASLTKEHIEAMRSMAKLNG